MIYPETQLRSDQSKCQTQCGLTPVPSFFLLQFSPPPLQNWVESSLSLVHAQGRPGSLLSNQVHSRSGGGQGLKTAHYTLLLRSSEFWPYSRMCAPLPFQAIPIPPPPSSFSSLPCLFLLHYLSICNNILFIILLIGVIIGVNFMGAGMSLSCSLLCLQDLAQCLLHSRCSVHTCPI